MKLRFFIMTASLGLFTAVMTIAACLFSFGPFSNRIRPPEEWLGKVPIGFLGYQLGTRIALTGNSKEGFKTGRNLMWITHINGHQTPSQLNMQLENCFLLAEYVYELEGAELGRYRGHPYWAYYEPYFVVTKILKATRVEQTDFPDDEKYPSAAIKSELIQVGIIQSEEWISDSSPVKCYHLSLENSKWNSGIVQNRNGSSLKIHLDAKDVEDVASGKEQYFQKGDRVIAYLRPTGTAGNWHWSIVRLLPCPPEPIRKIER